MKIVKVNKPLLYKSLILENNLSTTIKYSSIETIERLESENAKSALKYWHGKDYYIAKYYFSLAYTCHFRIKHPTIWNLL